MERITEYHGLEWSALADSGWVTKEIYPAPWDAQIRLAVMVRA